MKKSLIANLFLFGLIIGGTATVSAINQAAAEEQTAQDASMEESQDMFHAKVERTVENIDNGVVITLTTDDQEVLEKLQAQSEFPEGKGPMMEDVQQSVSPIENGVQITLTSDDAETVEKLQNMPEPGQRPFEGQIERTVEMIDNGVVITLTTDDEDALEFLQNHSEEGFGSGFGGHHGPKHMMEQNDQQ